MLVFNCVPDKKIFFIKNLFFITKMPNIIAETNDNFSHDHFELYNFIVAQKLKILEGGLHWWPFCNFISNIEMSKTIKKN